MKRLIFFLSIVIVLSLIGWYIYSMAEQNSLSRRMDRSRKVHTQVQSHKPVPSKSKAEPIKPKEKKEKQINRTNEEEFIPVRVEKIVLKPFTAKIRTVGTSRAKEDYVLSAKLNGEITYLYGDIGTKGKKGTILAKIDPEMVEANLKRLKPIIKWQQIPINVKRTWQQKS